MRKLCATALVLGTMLLYTSARPEAQLIESLTVILLPGSASFTLTTNSATNAASVVITATTSWLVLPVRNNVSLYAYFSSSTAALAHTAASNTVDIPSSRVEVSINGAASVPFNQTVVFGAANAGRQVFSQAINLFNLNSSRADTLALNINLSGYPLPADTYTGSLRLRARATP